MVSVSATADADIAVMMLMLDVGWRLADGFDPGQQSTGVGDSIPACCGKRPGSTWTSRPPPHLLSQGAAAADTYITRTPNINEEVTVA